MTKETTREDALKWWGGLEASDKQRVTDKHNGMRTYYSMTCREIEAIYKAEVLDKGTEASNSEQE